MSTRGAGLYAEILSKCKVCLLDSHCVVLSILQFNKLCLTGIDPFHCSLQVPIQINSVADDLGCAMLRPFRNTSRRR